MRVDAGDTQWASHPGPLTGSEEGSAPGGREGLPASPGDRDGSDGPIDAARSRFAFLAQASCILASALDYEALDQVVRLAVPYLCDWCVIDIADDDGILRQATGAHSSPDRERLLREAGQHRSPELVRANLVRRVMQTGAAELHPYVADPSLGGPHKLTDDMERIQSIWLQSVICVPLLLRGRAAGAISFVCGETGREFGPDDLELAEALSRNTAIALENARLYQEAQLARTEAEAVRRKLEREDAAKDRFIAMLAHELRNPLGVIKNAVELMRASTADAAALSRATDIVERQVHHQSRLVDDLLDVSRIAHDKIELRKETVDLTRLVVNAAEDQRGAVERAGLALRVKAPEAPVFVQADSIRISQALLNLLHNALKFTTRGGSLTVRLETARQEAIVTVEDTGVGIDPDQLPHLFEPFMQVETGHEKGLGGLGLGLALVKGLIELHGGRVAGASAGPGFGSAFSFWLPLASPPILPPPESAEHQSHVCIRVLVIEDDVDSAVTLRDMLELFGHVVETAGSGSEGVERAISARPDVVLCDIGLPGMDGYAVAAALRADPRTASTTLIAVTGFGETGSTRAPDEARFDLYLTKPIEPEYLRHILGEARPRS